MLEKGLIEDFRHMELMHTLEEFYNLQGKCERIKNTPLPRQYSYFSAIFVWIFILIMPFGLVGEFAGMGHNFIWLTVPFYALISWIFITMELVGDNSEDPFENFVNDVPMTALCRTIEIDLRDMLGETDLPEKLKPVNGVLM
jgi:putative membrane protein